MTLFKKNPVFDALPATDKGSTLVEIADLQPAPVSPDGQKIVLCNDHEISYAQAPFDPAQGKQFLNRFSETIKDCQWLNNDYVIFTLNNTITISEIDTRGNINIVSLPSTYAKASADKQAFIPTKIQFNQSDKKLYILTENTTLVSERLLP